MSIRALLFDLDNTLYPHSSGVMQGIDQRIGEYLQQRLGLSEEDALTTRRDYLAAFGTTLRGLQHHYGEVETEEYLQFVHDVGVENLLRFDEQLDVALARLPVRKVIFTNSPHEHAERVLAAMGVAQHFERIFDLRYFGFVGKPEPSTYRHILEQLDVSGDEALLLEDTAANLDPAKALGMTTILITPEPRDYAAADYQAPDVLAALRLAEPLVAPLHRGRKKRKGAKGAPPGPRNAGKPRSVRIDKNAA